MRRRVEAGHTWERSTEWNSVRALLAHEAQTEMGRELAATAEPLTDPHAVRAELEVTRQARLALATSSPLPLHGIPDIRPVLERCRVAGSVLDGAELALLAPALLATPGLAAYAKSVRTVALEVAAIIDSLPRFPELADRLGRSLDADGAVTDDASPRLRHLRREIRERRRRLTAELERAFQDPEAERLFAERYVTIRHGRYVLPLRAEARSRVRGIVHDRSQSGQTLFVEPEHTVDANNDLVQAVRDEEHETARVLAELTDAVRERIDDLERLVATVGRLDWIFVRGEAADRMEATEPLIDEGRTLSLKSARHPLLLAQSWTDAERPVVPMDIELTAERPLLLITGPNAGTDPDEGAALAQAILEELAERGALVIATTHLEPLKAFASTHPRARNASVEFDTATLAPTFRLRYDQPGQSYALTVAARLGLGPELIARAHAHRSEHAARLSELLATLDAHARTEAARAREPARLRRGQRVSAEHLGIKGERLTIAGSTATVRSGTLRVRVPLQALPPVDGSPGPSAGGGGAGSVRVGYRAKEPAPPHREIAPELLLLGRTTDEARDAVEKYLDDAFLAGLPSVRLIHGKGSGALRKAVRDLLTAHPLVDSFRDGESGEGGTGATVAALKVS